jgi:hypothetical protein
MKLLKCETLPQNQIINKLSTPFCLPLGIVKIESKSVRSKLISKKILKNIFYDFCRQKILSFQFYRG